MNNTVYQEIDLKGYALVLTWVIFYKIIIIREEKHHYIDYLKLSYSISPHTSLHCFIIVQSLLMQ